MPKFCKTKEKAIEKSKTLETTSYATSDTSQGGWNLNEEANNSVGKFRLMGREKAKNKASSSSVPSESSAAALVLVDMIVDK